VKRKSQLGVLGYPSLIWFLLFLVGPLALVLITSFLTRGTYGGIEWTFSADAYVRILNPVYLEIFWQSLKLSLLTTFLCLAIGYPMAWAMATASETRRLTYIFLMSIPFLMNLIIRVFAIRLFVGFDGPLLALLNALHIPNDPYAFSQNQVLVLYGMVTAYLPFMVFPLYSALEKFDFALVEASYDLGGSDWDVLFKVLIPNTRTAIANGCLLVFVPCLGEFVIPDLLGGAKNMLIGNLITEQFLKSRDWPFGSALSVVLILILTLMAFGIQRWGQGPRSKQAAAPSEKARA
jgi:spermidine/putrescine transport system permease protein